MDWSSILTQFLEGVLWGVLGFWGELIAGAANANESDGEFDQSDSTDRLADPFAASAGDSSMQSFTGQGNSDPYNSINSSSVYSASGLSQTAQLSAPFGLMDNVESSSTFDGPFSAGSRDTSDWLALNGPAGIAGDQNTVSGFGPSSPGEGSISITATGPGGEWQGTLNGQVYAVKFAMVNGTQWTQYYSDGVLVLQYPTAPDGVAGQTEGTSGTTTARVTAASPATAPIASAAGSGLGPIYSDPSYVGITSDVTSINTSAQAANSLQPLPNPFYAPSGYVIRPPPQVSAQGAYNFIPQGFVWSQFQSAAREVNDANNPAWARGLLYGLGSAAAPLALFEEGLRDALNAVSDMATRGGEQMGRASMWWEQGGYGEAVEDSLFAIVDESTAFVGALQIAQPVVSAGQNAFVAKDIIPGGSALGSELEEVIRINELFGEKVRENAALMREALAQGDTSLLEQWLYSGEFESYERGEMQAANVGKAIERMVAADLALDSATSKYFAYVAGPSRADFYGIGAAQGFFWDVTTEGGIVSHELEMERWYAPRTFVWGYTL
jgi:hypothetical protein